MHSLLFWKALAVVGTIHLALLIAIVVGLGVAIRESVVDPPDLDLGYASINITAYSTHDPECPPYTNCPLHSAGPAHKYDVIVSIHHRASTGEPYDRIARVLVIPLPH